MAGELGEHDAAQVVLVAKFGEERGRGATAAILRVDGVREVHRNSQSVDCHIDPLAHRLPPGPLFEVERQQHEHNPERVGVEDGRRVEAQRAGQHLAHVQFAPAIGQQAPVFGHESYAREHIYNVGQRQVAEHGDDVGVGRGFEFHASGAGDDEFA